MKFRLYFILFLLLLDFFLLPQVLDLSYYLKADGIKPGFLRWKQEELERPWTGPAVLVGNARVRTAWYWAQLMLGAAVLSVFNRRGLRHRKKDYGPGGPPAAGEGQFGTSRWQTDEEIKANFKMVRVPSKKVPGGIVVGAEMRGNRFYTWLDVGDTHVLLIGATRSGKSRRVILSTIWMLAHAGESMILTDIKGELNAHSAKFLKAMGYKVIILDFREPGRGNRWNLLAPVLDALKRCDYSKASRAAQAIAHIMTSKGMPPGHYKGDPIWPDSQKSLNTALIMAAAMEAPEKAKHMGSVYRTLVTLGSRGGELLDAYFDHLSVDHQARIDYGVAAMAEDKLKSSIYTGTAAQLALWADPGVCWMTSCQDHDLAGPGKEKTAVFLVIPDEDSAFHALASIYVTQAYQALVQLSNKSGGVLPLRVNFLLDEFGNLPNIPDFDTKITTAAGRNMKFLLAVQGMDQLRKHYGIQADTISGNCATWIYLSTANPETQKLLSFKTGQYTVRTESFSSHSRAKEYSYGTSDGLAGRPLLTPDEIERWPRGRSLIFKTGHYPARLPLPDISEWPAAADLVKDNSVYEEEVKFEMPEFWVPEFFKEVKKKAAKARGAERVGKKEPARDAIDSVH